MTLASNRTTSRLHSPRRAAVALCHRLASRTPDSCKESTHADLGRGSPKVGSCSQNVASDGDISGGVGMVLLSRVAGRLPRFQPSLVFPLCNSAVEQAASAARPWQAAQSKTQARSGPRPVRRSPLLTASVRRIWGVL
jgi:hypothetical protein